MPGALILAFLLAVLIAAFPAWPYSRRWGYAPSGGVGLLFVLTGVVLLVGVY